MDEKTRSRVVQLLDKLYDDEASRKEYFEIMNKSPKGNIWDDYWDQAQVKEMIKHVKANRDTPGQRYDVQEENGVEVLILKRSGIFNKVYRKVMMIEESYDILSKAHREVGHQGYKPIFLQLRKWWNFPIRFVTTLISSCKVCKILKNIQFVKGNFEDYTTVSKEAWRLGLLDMETECPYILTPKHILICEDAYSEFLILRPLNEKSVDEISEQLLKTFLQFGSPKTISANPLIIYDVLGPALRKITKAHPQFAVTTDDKDAATAIRNCDIVNALKKWIEEVECTNYEIDCELGCHVVQRKLNKRLRLNTSRWNSKYKAFVPHNLFMRHNVLLCESWDEDVILRLVEKEPVMIKRKRKMN